MLHEVSLGGVSGQQRSMGDRDLALPRFIGLWRSRNSQACLSMLVVNRPRGRTTNMGGLSIPAAGRASLAMACLGAGAPVAGGTLPLGGSVSAADWIST